MANEQLKEQQAATDAELTDKGLMWNDKYVSGPENETGIYSTRKGTMLQYKGYFNSPIEVTFEQARALRSTSDLKQGCWYLITDFQTIYDQPDYQSNGATKAVVSTLLADPMPIMCLALSGVAFAKEVHRPSTPNQILHYDFDFTETEYMGEPAKGRITYCKDEFGNETTYDHTVVLLKRYESVSGSGVFDSYKDTGFASTEVKTFGTACRNNKIGTSGFEVAATGFVIGNNTFGANAIHNTFGDDTNNNTFGTGLAYNTFGGNTNNNTFGKSTINNVFSGLTQYNAFGDFTQYNTFGGNTDSNTFGDNTRSNTFRSNTRDNTFGDYAQNNTFGDDTRNLVFGNNTQGNTCLGTFSYNSSVNNFKNNIIESNTHSSDFTGATHVHSNYPCTIFATPNATLKLSYIDDLGVLQVVNPTD